MSKIFDALRKTESETAHLAMSWLGQPNHAAEIAVSEPTAGDLATEPEPEPPGVKPLRTEAIGITPDSPILPFDGSHTRASEQYRIIRTKILHHPSQPRVLVVSSPMPGDGKSITAINVAGALALQEGCNVALVDADFRRSSLAETLGLAQGPGLSSVLSGSATLDEAMIQVEQLTNLYILPRGETVPVNPTELLASRRWEALCETLRSQFRITIFDAPPVASVADYELLQDACDGVLLVMRPEHTDRSLCRQALDTVPKDKQIGVILNCAEDWFLWKTQSYYYYSGTEKSK